MPAASSFTLHLPPVIRHLGLKCARASGQAFLVGGAVRDLLSKQSTHDYDLVIAGLSPATVKDIASSYGHVHDVGRSFGTLRLITTRTTVDIALPRRESKIAPGHRGFAIHANPRIPIVDDLRRRDFTINAMAINLSTNTVLDPFGGQRDLRRHILCIVDAQTFGDDPLRLLRGVQFAARFALRADLKSLRLMKKMAGSIIELPAARIFAEWEKFVLLAKKPSLGLRIATTVDVFSPLVGRTVRFPETLYRAVDHLPSLPAQHRQIVFWSLLLRAIPVKSQQPFLLRLGFSRNTYHQIRRLTAATHRLPKKIGRQEVFSLARRLDPLPVGHAVSLLGCLRPITSRTLARTAKRYHLLHQPPPHVLSGHELIGLGIKPGAGMGQLLAVADDAHDRGITRSEILAGIRQSKNPVRALRALMRQRKAQGDKAA